MAGVIDTIEKTNRLKPDRIAFYSYAHVPWTSPGQRSYTEADLPRDKDKRALYEKGKQLFEETGYVEIGMDHFALKTDSLYEAWKNGTLHRNFMSYSSSTSMLIGLDVSSISDTWMAIGQYVKKVEEYRKVVATGHSPVFRGHLLTEENLKLRQHIST